MRRLTMMIALARAMNASMTAVRFSADGEFFEAAVVPGVCSLDRRPPGGLQGCGFPFGRDLVLTAELVQRLCVS
jgi:hypothetical protein